MRWRTGRRSSNIEDRRGMRPAGLGRGVKGGGIGTILLVLAALYFGIDPSIILNQGMAPSSSSVPRSGTTVNNKANDELADFVSVVLADTEDTWQQLFRKMDRTYREPNLVLFSGAVNSACGFAQAALGPFYCPGDQKVYIDLSFYRDLKTRHQSPGDFAQAYVIAHEIGHHVQNLLGISQEVQNARRRLDEKQANQLSVKQELQADCLAGIWAHHADRTRNILETGDINEALNAASNIGDDRLQQRSKGYVTPDSFTHGSSEQRTQWFKRGVKTGDFATCNTFKAQIL